MLPVLRFLVGCVVVFLVWLRLLAVCDWCVLSCCLCVPLDCIVPGFPSSLSWVLLLPFPSTPSPSASLPFPPRPFSSSPFTPSRPLVPGCPPPSCCRSFHPLPAAPPSWPSRLLPPRSSFFISLDYSSLMPDLFLLTSIIET